MCDLLEDPWRLAVREWAVAGRREWGAIYRDVASASEDRI